jgi:hypothetical protein
MFGEDVGGDVTYVKFGYLCWSICIKWTWKKNAKGPTCQGRRLLELNEHVYKWQEKCNFFINGAFFHINMSKFRIWWTKKKRLDKESWNETFKKKIRKKNLFRRNDEIESFGLMEEEWQMFHGGNIQVEWIHVITNLIKNFLRYSNKS